MPVEIHIFIVLSHSATIQPAFTKCLLWGRPSTKRGGIQRWAGHPPAPVGFAIHQNNPREWVWLAVTRQTREGFTEEVMLELDLRKWKDFYSQSNHLGKKTEREAQSSICPLGLEHRMSWELGVIELQRQAQEVAHGGPWTLPWRWQ